VAKIGADRKARNSLTVEVILDAAEGVAAGGFEAVTIRAVATALEASPMALYRYFSTKNELVDALLNRVLGRFLPPPESSNWLEDLGAFARSHEALLIGHPWAIAALISRPFPGANALPIGEVALHILERGGMVGDEAVATFSGLLALNYGRASFAVSLGEEGGLAAVERIGRLPSVNADYPVTARSAEALGRYGSDDHYERILGQLLAGIGRTV
jgi:AcrR family transcriptional regulator